MDSTVMIMIAGAAVIGFVLGWIFNSTIGKNKIKDAKLKAAVIIEDAEKESKNLKREKLLEVKDEWLKKKQDFDSEINSRRQKAQNFEKKLENFKVIGGGYNGEKIDIKKINFLATLPSMDELRGKILGLISAPAQKIASIVKEPSGQLARLVSAHGDKMDKSN